MNLHINRGAHLVNVISPWDIYLTPTWKSVYLRFIVVWLSNVRYFHLGLYVT